MWKEMMRGWLRREVILTGLASSQTVMASLEFDWIFRPFESRGY